MTLDSRLKEIKERCEAATEEPWFLERDLDGNAYPYIHDSLDLNGQCLFKGVPLKGENGMLEMIKNTDFIAHARTDVPMLLEMLEATIDWEDVYTLKALEKIAEKYER